MVYQQHIGDGIYRRTWDDGYVDHVDRCGRIVPPPAPPPPMHHLNPREERAHDRRDALYDGQSTLNEILALVDEVVYQSNTLVRGAEGRQAKNEAKDVRTKAEALRTAVYKAKSLDSDGE